MAYSADGDGIWETMIYVPEERAWLWAPSGELGAVLLVALIPNTIGLGCRLARRDWPSLLLLSITLACTLASIVASYQLFSGVQGGTVFDGRLACPTMALFSMALDGVRTTIQLFEQEIDSRFDNAKSLATSSSATLLTVATFGLPGPTSYGDNSLGFWATSASVTLFLATYVGSVGGARDEEPSSPRQFVDFACSICTQVTEAYALWHLSEDAISVLALILILALMMFPPLAAGNFKTRGLAEHLICLGNMCLKCYLCCKHIHLPDGSV